MNFEFLPDLPIKFRFSDRLNFFSFAEKIKSAIYRTSPPFTYGVLGDWGAGKTSILNMLFEILKTTQNDDDQAKLFVPIRFDAWKYENEESLIFPLLHAIRKDYIDRRIGKDETFNEKFKEVAITTTLALSDVALRAATKMLTGEALSLSDVNNHFLEVRSRASQLENILSGWANEVDVMHSAFTELLDCFAVDLVRAGRQGVATKDVRFVILIDDLDRCLPQTVIKILESIKNFLLNERCIFILSVNPQVVYQGIRVKYSGLEVDGREYLEKMINYSFYVPDPEPEQAELFACAALNELVRENDRASLEPAINVFGKVVRECKFTNPRKVKRILNHYLFFLSLHETDLTRFHLPTIIRLIVMAEYFPLIFQTFCQDPDVAREAVSDNIQIEIFLNHFGADITPYLPKLGYMKGLFNLVSDPRYANLAEHTLAVYQIVHHPQ